jgi:hypothetical protein
MNAVQSILAVPGAAITLDDAVSVANGNQRDGGPIGRDGIDLYQPGYAGKTCISLTAAQARQLGRVLLDLTEPCAAALVVAAE